MRERTALSINVFLGRKFFSMSYILQDTIDLFCPSDSILTFGRLVDRKVTDDTSVTLARAFRCRGGGDDGE